MNVTGRASPGRLAIVVMLAALALALSACDPSADLDPAKVATIARDFVVAGQPSGYEFLDLTNDPPQIVGGHWRVKVDARIRIPQNPPTEASLHFLIDVDRHSGQPTIEAQG